MTHELADIGWDIDMPQLKNLAELETILLSELRDVKGCEGAAQATIIVRSAGYWVCGPVRPGTAHAADCRQALGQIEKRLQNLYRLKV